MLYSWHTHLLSSHPSTRSSTLQDAFILHKGNCVPSGQYLPLSPPQPLVTTIVLSASTALAFSDFWCKWDHDVHYSNVPFATAWRNFEGVKLSEMNQTDLCCFPCTDHSMSCRCAYVIHLCGPDPRAGSDPRMGRSLVCWLPNPQCLTHSRNSEDACCSLFREGNLAILYQMP